MVPIVITVGPVTLYAELDDSRTARQLWMALPFESTADAWSGGLAFDVPVEAASVRDVQPGLEPGEIAYAAATSSLVICLDAEPYRAESTEVVGRVTADRSQVLARLRDVPAGSPVRVMRAAVA